jgi:YggT family protein
MFILLGLYLLAGFSFFLGLIYWAIIIDILLSWLTLLGVQIIIGPLNSITRPLYDLTRKIFPTRVGMIDLAPLVIILILDVLRMGVIPFLTHILRS